MKIRKFLVRALVVLLVVITAALVVRAILNYTTGKKLEKYLAEAKAQGVPLAMRDMIPSCPDTDNGAKLWKAVEALFEVEPADRELMDKTIDGYFYGISPDEQSLTRLAALAENNKKALDLVIAAEGKPCFRYGDWTKPSYDVEMPKAVKLIQVTRLLAINAALRADKGEIKEALDELRSGMRFTRRLMDEPFAITALVAIADMKILLISFDHIVQGKDIAAELISPWMSDLATLSWRERFIRSIPAERAFALEFGLDLIDGKRAPIEALETPNAVHRFYFWMIRPALKSELGRFLRQREDDEKIAGSEYYQISEALANSRSQARLSTRFPLIIGQVVSGYQAVLFKEATLEAMMLTTRAGLACKIYRKQHGRYPANLAALVPGVLDKEPIDPFTGKPLIYKVQDDEVLIYSVGANQKDDGGRGTYKITKLVMDKDDDWAWKETIEIPGKR